MTKRDIVSAGLRLGLLSALAVAGLAGPAPATQAQNPRPPWPVVEQGRGIAERDCSSCHAIGPTGESPLEGAPRWRDLHDRFDVTDLGEALAEGIMVGHEAMPAKPYEPADVQALIAYLKSLETSGAVTPKR